MANEKLLALAQLVGDDWTYSEYYDRAEKTMDLQWELLVWPFIQDCDFSSVLELAAGHGRNTRPLLEHTKKLYAVDMNGGNIDFIRRRFKDNDRITYIVNNGIDLAGIPDEEVTFIYSFDSMVHFDGDVVRACLRDSSASSSPAATASATTRTIQQTRPARTKSTRVGATS